MDELIQCPYCGEEIEISVDEGGGLHQEYIEDCQVCCRPMRLVVSTNEEGDPSLSVGRVDD